jgi:hypothetical protein
MNKLIYYLLNNVIKIILLISTPVTIVIINNFIIGSFCRLKRRKKSHHYYVTMAVDLLHVVMVTSNNKHFIIWCCHLCFNVWIIYNRILWVSKIITPEREREREWVSTLLLKMQLVAFVTLSRNYTHSAFGTCAKCCNQTYHVIFNITYHSPTFQVQVIIQCLMIFFYIYKYTIVWCLI